MSVTSSRPLPPVSVQESVIESALNGTLITNLFAGLYSAVYFATMYLYLTRKSAKRRRVVIGIINIIYIAYLLNFISQWYMLKLTIVNEGSTRGKLFIAVAFSPGWGNIIDTISSFLLSSLADTLLIWRCFYVWDRSIRAILLSVVLLVAEVGVYLFIIIKASVEHLTPSPHQAKLLNQLIAASMFTTFACTMTTTILIIYRIYPIMHLEGSSSNAAQRFRNILDILVQSAALYSVAALAYAISSVLPLNNTSNTSLVAAQIYSSSIFLCIAGIAPTVMVARVTLSTSDNPTIPKPLTHISGLRFQAQSTTPDEVQSSEETNGESTEDAEKGKP